MLLKFEIIWTKIGQIIRSQNNINFSETTSIFQIINVLQYPVYLHNIYFEWYLHLDRWLIYNVNYSTNPHLSVSVGWALLSNLSVMFL